MIGYLLGFRGLARFLPSCRSFGFLLGRAGARFGLGGFWFVGFNVGGFLPQEVPGGTPFPVYK